MSFIGKQTEYLDFAAFTFFKFPKPIPCGDNLNFCQPALQTDDVAFQFKASESENLVTNGDFGSNFIPNLTGWTPVGWGARVSVLGNVVVCMNLGVNNLSQKGILTVGDFFKVTITVSDFSAGVLVVGGGTGSAIFNGVLTIRSNGTFTGFFEYNEGGGAGDFIIQGSNTFIGCVDDVEVIKISDTSDYTIQIHDAVTFILIDTVPAANLSQVEDIITVDFNWTDDVSVPNGCVVIRVFDATNIFEDDFDTNQGWIFASSDITITGGEMRFLSTPTIQPTPATISGVFTVGESYEITYDVVLRAGDSTVTVRCGKTDGTTRSSVATFVEVLECTVNNELVFRFTGSAGAAIRIDNIFIKKADDLDGESECIELATIHDCSLLWVWSNNESWRQFDYSTGFEHKMRVICEFRGTAYPSNLNIGEDSKGLREMDYTRLRKVNILDIDSAAEHIHDAIAAFFVQDNRVIDGVSYLLDEEYEPSAPNDSVVKFRNLMTATVELEKSDQPNQINRNI